LPVTVFGNEVSGTLGAGTALRSRGVR